MDTFAQKTLRGMADTLHLPDSMRCCGVGAIEAQIAAGDDDDDDKSTSDDSVFSVTSTKGSRRDDRGQPLRAKGRSSKEGAAGGQAKQLLAKEKGGGGLRGMLSSARSLAWGRRKGGAGVRGEEEDNRSQSSQVSGLSFLSGGLKMLSSTSKSIFNSFRAPSPLLDDGFSEATFTLTSTLYETEDSDRREPARGFLLWRRVRMIVRGVRGMQGAPGESSRFKATVTYQAARRTQAIVRRNLAYKAAAERRLTALASLKRGEELRRQRRHREADARKRYRAACRSEGERLFDWSVKVFLQPRAIVDLQRVWRGYRARKRLAAYLKWLEDRARRRREYQRYLAALAAQRAAGRGNSEQVKRRVWGRVEFAHTGWRPRYEVENPPKMNDHIWAPPRGSSSGVRTLKVLLPPASERDRVTLVKDKNAWAGIPVGIAKRNPPPERLGPPARPGTITATADADRDRRHVPSSVSGGGSGAGEGEFLTKYNWVPAPLVAKTALLQDATNESDRNARSS